MLSIDNAEKKEHLNLIPVEALHLIFGDTVAYRIKTLFTNIPKLMAEQPRGRQSSKP